MTANVLTVTGYTAGGALSWDMSEVVQGAFCSESSGNTCAPVRYLSGLPVVGESDGLRELSAAIRTAPSPTTVLGFSQGATVAARWLRENAGKAGAPSPENLSFVLIASPLRKYGGVRPAYGIEEPTPDTGYDVLDIAIEYDGAADFPDDPFNFLAVANALAGFNYVHIYGYVHADLESADKLVWKDGNTTYVLIRSQNIPLLEPLRRLGLDDLADRLNGPLKAIIDSAYDRDYPGMVNQASQVAAQRQVSSFDADLTDAEPVAAAVSPGAGDRTPQVTEPTPQLDTDTPDATDPETPVDADDQDVVDTETNSPTVNSEDNVAEDIDVEDIDVGDASDGMDNDAPSDDDATTSPRGGAAEGPDRASSEPQDGSDPNSDGSAE